MVNSYYLKIKFDDFSLMVETAPEYSPREQIFPMHFHPTYELHMINRGETVLTDENTTYKASAGKMLIVPPMCYHGAENSKDVSKIAFSVRIFSDNAKSSFYKKMIKLLSAERITIIEFGNIPELDALISICTSPASFSKKETEYLLKSYFTILFLKLTTFSEQTDISLLEQNYTESILNYIVAYFEQPVSVGALAEKLNLSVRHTEKIIRERLKGTFTGILNEYRINIAKKRIIALPETPLEQIAISVGFNNYSYFYKQFVKHTGISPLTFKNANK